MTEGSILAATDLSARGDRAIDRALHLGGALGLPVRVVHIVEGRSSEEERPRLEQAVRSALPDPAAEVEIILASGSPPAEIANIANDGDAALIVTGMARFNAIGDYFLGTSVDALIRKARKPVLVVKQRAHFPYRRILCATDFSERSIHALRATLALFPDADIMLLNAYHVGFEGWQRDGYVKDETQAAAREDLDRFVASLKLSPEDRARIEPRLGYGDPDAVVVEEAARSNPDLVVAGTRGSGLRQVTLGSTASSILEHAVTDTMVVPPA